MRYAKRKVFFLIHLSPLYRSHSKACVTALYSYFKSDWKRATEAPRGEGSWEIRCFWIAVTNNLMLKHSVVQMWYIYPQSAAFSLEIETLKTSLDSICSAMEWPGEQAGREGRPFMTGIFQEVAKTQCYKNVSHNFPGLLTVFKHILPYRHLKKKKKEKWWPAPVIYKPLCCRWK